MKSHSILSAVALSLVFAPDIALAQSCTEDVDCAPEDYCDLYPSAGDSSDSSGGPGCAPGEECSGAAPSEGEASEDPVPVTEQPTAGQCERGGRECTSDDQCLDEHYCSLDKVDSAVTCPAGAECSDIAAPAPAASGRCEHNPYTCSSDADCPEPAVCGEDGECIYQLEACETNDECSADYECLPLRGGSSSMADPSLAQPMPDPAGPPNSGADSGGAQSADDDEDSAAEAAAPDEEGAQDVAVQDVAAEDDEDSEEPAGICFPELVECETDEDCTDGWICADIDDGPPNWEEVERACLPPGIAAALDGDLEVDGGEGSNDSGGLGAEGEIPTIDGSDEDVVGLGTQGGSEGSAPDDACNVAAAGGHGRGVTWAWLAGVLALMSVRSVKRRL